MKFEDFKQLKEFEDFKKLKTLNLKNYEEFKIFYDRITGGESHWHYTANLVVNDLVTQNKYKYVVVDMEDGDKVFIELKLIQLHKTRQLRIVNVPVSLNNNDDNIKKITKHLSSLSYIKGTVKYDDIKYFEDWIVEKRKEETEHYSEIDAWSEKCDNNKWKTKRRIKWTLNDSNFIFREAVANIDKDIMINLFNSWCEYKDSKGQHVSNKRLYLKLIDYIGKREDVKGYIMTYKGEAVALVVYTLHNNTANQIINISASRTMLESDNEKVRKIFFDLTHQMTWFTYKALKKLGFKFIYCGDGTDSKGMEIYKSQCNTNIIEYVKIKPL